MKSAPSTAATRTPAQTPTSTGVLGSLLAWLVSRFRSLLCSQALRHVVVAERQRPLHGFDLRRRRVERARDRHVQCSTAPFEAARELAHAPIGDRERRALMSDRDNDERGGR